jgi:thiol-disulfide isomerase/thioredoxin
MKKIKLYSLLLLLWSFGNTMAFCQQPTLKVGDKIPDLEFRQVVNFSRKSARLSDFKGKAVILDFWATWCKACVSNFPKNDSLQKEFSSKLQFILVTLEQPEKVSKFFKRVQPAKSFSLPSVSDTSAAIGGLFTFKEIPHYIWIDTSGIIRAITGSDRINKRNIEDFIAGQLKGLTVKTDAAAVNLDTSNPLLSDKNLIKQTNIISYSLLSDGITGALYLSSTPQKGIYANRRIAGSNLSMERLFCLAYGKGFDLNTVPSKRVIFEDSLTRSTVKKYYTYDLIIPQSDSAALYRTMKEDLYQKFGHKASFQNREKYCVVISQISPGSVKASASNDLPVSEHNQFYILLKKQPMSELRKSIKEFLKGDLIDVLDETGYSGNIDIDVKVNLADLAALNQALMPYGLSVRKEIRPISMLVISKKDHSW